MAALFPERIADVVVGADGGGGAVAGADQLIDLAHAVEGEAQPLDVAVHVRNDADLHGCSIARR